MYTYKRFFYFILFFLSCNLLFAAKVNPLNEFSILTRRPKHYYLRLSRRSKDKNKRNILKKHAGRTCTLSTLFAMKWAEENGYKTCAIWVDGAKSSYSHIIPGIFYKNKWHFFDAQVNEGLVYSTRTSLKNLPSNLDSFKYLQDEFEHIVGIYASYNEVLYGTLNAFIMDKNFQSNGVFLFGQNKSIYMRFMRVFNLDKNGNMIPDFEEIKK